VAQPAHPRVVVQEPDRPELERRVAQDLAQDRLSTRPGADDEDVEGVARRVEAARRTVPTGIISVAVPL